MPCWLKRNSIFLSALVIFLYYFLLFSRKILLVTSDLGRHITNGEYVFKDNLVLYTNFYSFTQPNYNFINHHWLFGVYSYFIHTIGGFTLLGVFNSLTYALAVIFPFIYIFRERSKTIAIVITLFFAPLFALRTEVRPETFSFLFLSIYIFLCLLYIYKRVSRNVLFITLVVMQLVWVNVHIFFILGLAVVGFLLIHLLINKDNRYKQIFILGLLMVLASLINPFFYKGLLAPLNIFKEYGYMIVENQSIIFMHRRLLKFEYIYYELFSVVMFFLAVVNIKKIKDDAFLYLLLVMSFILSFRFNRAIPIFALTSLYFFSVSLFSKQSVKHISNNLFPAFFIIFISLAVLPTPFSPFANKRFGFGEVKSSNGSAEFILQNNIGGNVFNNYDIGGFLIYSLFDKHRVFVDNRPEAYSADFLENTYIRMQEDDKFWEQKRDEFDINAIYFYRLDYTPWAQPFLIRRLQEEDWVPVYVDAYTIILLYNNDSNEQIIKENNIPKEVFRSIKN